MGINGVSSYANTYTYGNVKNENVKPSKNSEKNYYAGYTMNSANKFKNVSDYSKYLTNKYKCLTPCKNASVLIDRSVMQKACGDEKTAKWLEENLAIMPDVIRNAQKAAISHGSKLISVEFKFTNNGTEMTTCGIFGETGTDSEIDKWLERMKEDKEKEDKKTENMIAIEATTKNNEAQGVSVIITSDKDIETLNKLADEFQKYPVSSQRSTAGLYALLEISGNLKREKDGFTFLTPNGVTYIPYDGDSSKAWEIDMPGSCYATARKCLAAENDCADISAWTKNLKGIKIYYGDNYGTTQTNNVYKVDDLGRYYMFA